ncbi:f5/8 type c domain containing protein [Anaeramoeba flamelloides]|uniref:F5/8 type c domain containing protein n=1 Tax=Anaeramoeba flamelloides TaxID=1746091 RepID=A0AAV7ZVK9_9EUKA|nr:f5/8 type c domain containing protein [Anaeramoeba flamelloides]
MQNLTLTETGGKIHSYSSQYHHESRCSNLSLRDPSLVWFSSVREQLPQHVIFKLRNLTKLSRVGIYLHGENNQNPKHMKILISKDDKNYEKIVDTEVEHRAGDFLFDLEEEKVIQYVKYMITKNRGGSGIYVSKCYAFGEVLEETKEKEK